MHHFLTYKQPLTLMFCFIWCFLRMVVLTVMKAIWGGGVYFQHFSVSLKFFPMLIELFLSSANTK